MPIILILLIFAVLGSGCSIGKAISSNSGKAGSTASSSSAATTSETTPTSLSYSTTNATYTQSSAISTNSTTYQGGKPTSYTISPSLPAGLSINSSTGAITGTPTDSSPQKTYTVTASNTAGSTTANITIKIKSTILNLSSGWSGVNTLANASSENVTVTTANATSVTTSFDTAGCGCNSQRLIVSLGKTLNCSESTLEFDYTASYSADGTNKPSLSIRFYSGTPPTPPALWYTGNEFVGTAFTGHSNCAFRSSWNNEFPTTAVISTSATNVINLGSMVDDPANNSRNGKCDSTFDTLDIHMAVYSCSGVNGSATLSNVRAY